MLTPPAGCRALNSAVAQQKPRANVMVEEFKRKRGGKGAAQADAEPGKATSQTYLSSSELHSQHACTAAAKYDEGLVLRIALACPLADFKLQSGGGTVLVSGG